MRAIDADELKTAFPVCDNSKPVLIASVRATINHMPTIDPEIVRCKDCKNRGDDDCPMRFIEWVEYDDDGYIEHDDIINDYTKDDGFCDRAERRTDVDANT